MKSRYNVNSYWHSMPTACVFFEDTILLSVGTLELNKKEEKINVLISHRIEMVSRRWSRSFISFHYKTFN
ncbi:Poxin-Schlafen [Dirofilaria immitis]